MADRVVLAQDGAFAEADLRSVEHFDALVVDAGLSGAPLAGFHRQLVVRQRAIRGATLPTG